MSDATVIVLGVLACAAFFGLYWFIDFVLPRILKRFSRRLSGCNSTDSWQPYLRPRAAILATLLALMPFLVWCLTSWPTTRGFYFYGTYISFWITLALLLSAYSPRFQRFAFLQPPVSALSPRRFAFGIVFFLSLFVVLSYALIFGA